MYGQLPRAVAQALVRAQVSTLASLQEPGRDISLKSILELLVHSVLQRLIPQIRYLETISPKGKTDKFGSFPHFGHSLSRL